MTSISSEEFEDDEKGFRINGNGDAYIRGSINSSHTHSVTPTYNTSHVHGFNTNTISTGFASYPCNACGIYGLHNCMGYRYVPTYYYWGGGVTATVKRCCYCDAISHDTPEKCSRVKTIEYHEDGKISKIKFHKPED